MTVRVTLVTVRWEPVVGATGYEISKDGVVVAKAGMNARTSKLSVDDSTVIEIRDLPSRKIAQEVRFSQEIGA